MRILNFFTQKVPIFHFADYSGIMSTMHSSMSVSAKSEDAEPKNAAKLKGTRCAVCFLYRKHCPDRRFFRFPKDPQLCKKWIEIINEPYLMKKTSKQMYSSYTLCSIHFTETDYLSSKMYRLKPSACPSQFIPKIDLDVSKMKQCLLNKLHPFKWVSGVNDDANDLNVKYEENYEGNSYKNSTEKSLVVAEFVYKTPDNIAKSENPDNEEHFTDLSFSIDLDENSKTEEQLISLKEGLACLRRLKPLIEKIDIKNCTMEANLIERLSLIIETEIDKVKT